MTKIIRLKLAIWMLRAARRLSDRAEVIIRSYEEEREVQEAELLKAWSELSDDGKRDFLAANREGGL